MKKKYLAGFVVSIVIFGLAVSAEAAGIDVNTVLMLHMDGDDGSTDFSDSSFSSHTVTAHEDAHIETDASKFGAASVYFDGSGDSLSIPYSSDWNFGSGDFTIDYWMKFDDSSNRGILGQGTTSLTGRGWWFEYWDGALIFYFHNNSGPWDRLSVSSTFTPNTDQLYHIAVVRDSSDTNLYVDGVLADSSSHSGSYYSSDHPLTIGGDVISDPDFKGYIDELRISKGIARWTEDFIPPAEPYSAVPLPGAVWLLGGGLAGLVGLRTRAKK